MKFDYSRATKPIGTSVIALKSAYKLQADASYDVIRNLGKDNKDLVALRTTKGRGRIAIEGFAPRTVTDSTLLVFEHNKVKRYLCEGNVWNFWWFEFALSGPLHLPLNTIMDIGEIQDEESTCEICLELLRSPNFASQALASATLNVLLSKWMFHLEEDKSKYTSHQDMIKHIISYMHSNLSANLTVTKMADIVGLSERRFRQVFKNITAEQPKRFYDRLKMEMALELLCNTSLSVGEISDKLGYSSQFHFSKAFRSFWGMPPSGYRANAMHRG